jgi:AraC-like DNA-binding protein
VDQEGGPFLRSSGNGTHRRVSRGCRRALRWEKSHHALGSCGEPRPGGQTQFFAPVWHDPPPAGPIQQACEIVSAQPASDLSVHQLAARVGVSRRHFSRLCAEQVSTSPPRYVVQVRIESARQLLETDSLDPSNIASQPARSASAARTPRVEPFNVAAGSHPTTTAADSQASGHEHADSRRPVPPGHRTRHRVQRVCCLGSRRHLIGLPMKR